MTKTITVSPAFGIPKNTLTFSLMRDGAPVEVCRFHLLDNGMLDIQIAPGIEMTDAARRFIEVVANHIENMPALDLLGAETVGRG